VAIALNFLIVTIWHPAIAQLWETDGIPALVEKNAIEMKTQEN